MDNFEIASEISSAIDVLKLSSDKLRNPERISGNAGTYFLEAFAILEKLQGWATVQHNYSASQE